MNNNLKIKIYIYIVYKGRKKENIEKFKIKKTGEDSKIKNE